MADAVYDGIEVSRRDNPISADGDAPEPVRWRVFNPDSAFIEKQPDSTKLPLVSKQKRIFGLSAWTF